MTTSDSGGAAFNPAVRTQDNAPEAAEAPERDSEYQNTEAEDGPTTGEDQGDGLR